MVQQGKVIAAAWLDRKVVTVMGSNSDPTEVGTVQRRQRDGTRQQIACPDLLVKYNRHMGGVDRGDQMRGYYRYKLKSRKFYKYIFFFLIDVSITNAFILYKHEAHQNKNLKEFRITLSDELIGDYCSRKRPGRISTTIRPLPLQHFPIRLSSENPSKHRRGRCSHCTSTQKKRRDSQWFCRECAVWLCHPGDDDDCFLHWHKRRVNKEQ